MKCLKLIIGILIFVGVLFMNKSSVFYLPMFIVSYLLIGGEVVFRAFRNILRGKVFDENFLMTIATIGAFTIGEYPEAVGGYVILSGRRTIPGYSNKSIKKID